LNAISLDNIPFFNKFTHLVEDTDDFYEIASGSGRGDAAYLTNLKTENPLELVLHGPIKMLYFLSSPLPWDWRGIIDIISFLYDGIIYLPLILYSVANFKKYVRGNPLSIGVFLMLITTVFIFGIGVNNAGTAMRHRYKIFYLIFILFLMVFNKKKNKALKNIS